MCARGVKKTNEETPSAAVRTLAHVRCRDCPLTGGLAVPPDYLSTKKYRFVIVGEAPGVVEETQGVPFVGPSGQLLRDTIRLVDASIPARDIYYTNVLLCRPPRNRIEAAPEAVETCTQRLHAELTRHCNDATTIIPLGGIAWAAVAAWLGRPVSGSIMIIRGSVYAQSKPKERPRCLSN